MWLCMWVCLLVVYKSIGSPIVMQNMLFFYFATLTVVCGVGSELWTQQNPGGIDFLMYSAHYIIYTSFLIAILGFMPINNCVNKTVNVFKNCALCAFNCHFNQCIQHPSAFRQNLPRTECLSFHTYFLG